MDTRKMDLDAYINLIEDVLKRGKEGHDEARAASEWGEEDLSGV